MSRLGKKRDSASNDSAADLGFEAKPWLAADKLRLNNHMVLGLILLNRVAVALKET